MSEFFVYPEDLSDVEETVTTTLRAPSFSEENYSFNQELRTIVENEINNLKTNKSAHANTLTNTITNTNTNDSKRDTQVSSISK